MTADWSRLDHRPAGADLEPDHRRGGRREPGGAGHHEQATGHDRVGVSDDPVVAQGLSPPERRRVALIVALGALSGFGPLCLDMYLPALPAASGRPIVDRDQRAADAVGVHRRPRRRVSSIVGPLSDRLGRRGPLLVGVAIFVVASVVCAIDHLHDAADRHAVRAGRGGRGRDRRRPRGDRGPFHRNALRRRTSRPSPRSTGWLRSSRRSSAGRCCGWARGAPCSGCSPASAWCCWCSPHWSCASPCRRSAARPGVWPARCGHCGTLLGDGRYRWTVLAGTLRDGRDVRLHLDLAVSVAGRLRAVRRSGSVPASR